MSCAVVSTVTWIDCRPGPLGNLEALPNTVFPLLQARMDIQADPRDAI